MKGQSKAIELVIVLFVLLIVAFVVIQIFEKFMTEGTQFLQDIQAQQQIKGQFDKFKQMCESKCLIYKQEQCKNAQLVEFCSYTSQGIDLNADGKIGGYVDNPAISVSLSGMGTCEERIPCFLVTQCSCTSEAPKIDAKECKEAICSHYKSLGLSGTQVDGILNQRMEAGACYDRLTQPLHWYELGFKKEAGTLTCS